MCFSVILKYAFLFFSRWLGTTQFQPVHARKVFPSLDEPQYKAKFTLTIDRPASYKPSLSNMPIDGDATTLFVFLTFFLFFKYLVMVS